MQLLLTILLALMIWGPPRLSVEDRLLDLSLVDPLAMDSAALFQFGTWGIGALVAAAAVVMLSRRGSIRFPQVIFEPPTRWYALFGMLAVFSAAYSPGPLLTLFFAGKIIVAIIVTSLVLRSANGPRAECRALDIMFVVYLLQAIAIASMYFLAPDLVGSELSLSTGAYRLHGGILRDWGASFLVSGVFFLSVAVFSKPPIRRTLGWVAYGISIVFLFLALTRTFNLSAIFILISVMLLQLTTPRKLAVVVLGLGVALTVFSLGYVEPLFFYLTRDLQGFETLNGRTVVFSFLLDHFSGSPILGYGFSAGSRVVLQDVFAQTGIRVGTAHDSLSRVLIDLGVVGTTVIAIAVISTCRELVVLRKRSRNIVSIYPTSVQLIALMIWLGLWSVTSGEGTFPDLSMPFLIVMMTSRLLNKKIRSDTALPATKRIHGLASPETDP